MGLIKGIAEDRGMIQPVTNLTAEELALAFRESGPYYNAAGVPVSQATSWRSSAVYACVRLILGGMTTMPIVIYDESNPKARVPIPDHWATPLLNLQPNPKISASTFWSAYISDKLLGGDGLALIQRIGPTPVGFEWIPRAKCQPQLSPQTGYTRLWYRYSDAAGKPWVKDQDDILHVPNIGWNGENGLSSIRAGAQGVGRHLAAEEYSARFFSNGARPDYTIQMPGKMTVDAAEVMVATMIKKHGGLKNAHLPGVITEGGTINQLSINAKDSQLLETMESALEDIARFFGVPPVMIGATQKTSSWGKGVAQQAAWLVMFNLQGQAESIEQEWNRKLFMRTPFRMRFDFTGLLRGDAETRYKNYDIARGGQDKPAFMSTNEIRAIEGHPSIEGGDKLYDPAERSAENE